MIAPRMAPPANSEQAPRRHIPALDGLRGIAILTVVVHNSNAFTASSGPLWLLTEVGQAGWAGVQLFFVLSGFLITGNLLDSRASINFYKTFFWRRALRIFPLYYVFLFVALIVVPMIWDYPEKVDIGLRQQLWLWIFLANWTAPFGMIVSGLQHFWSLCVEEQFYAIWPFCVRRFHGKPFAVLCLALILGAFISRILLLQAGASPEMVYMFSVGRLDALAFGALAAVLVRQPFAARAQRITTPLLILGTLCAALGAFATHGYSAYDPASQTIGYSVLALFFAALVLAAAQEDGGRYSWLQKILSVRGLRSPGKYSYAMYVFHPPIIAALTPAAAQYLQPFGSMQPVVFVMLVILVTYGAGFCSFHLLEKHFLRLKYRVAAP